jgi:hypothetical protein
MGMHFRIVSVLCVLALCAGAQAAASTERELIRGAVAATGSVDPIDVTLVQLAIEHELDRIAGRLGDGPPTVHRAHRLHVLLQKRYLREYDEVADGLSDIVDRRAYNCLSATLLYGLAAQRLGFEAFVLERPSHLRLRLRTGERAIDIETTQRHGFDRQAAEATDRAGIEETRTGGVHSEYRELPLEAAIGFGWLNRAWRELEGGRAIVAAEHASRALEHLGPPRETDVEELQKLFTRAFRAEYEQGRFDEALAIARFDASAFPDTTTSRDRLLAAAAKVIEDAADAGEPARAESILDDTVLRLAGTHDAERIVRQTAPIAAASAVRSGEFDRAARLAARYRDVEPDPIEGARLVAWVEARRPSDASPCP